MWSTTTMIMRYLQKCSPYRGHLRCRELQTSQHHCGFKGSVFTSQTNLTTECWFDRNEGFAMHKAQDRTNNPCLRDTMWKYYKENKQWKYRNKNNKNQSNLTRLFSSECHKLRTISFPLISKHVEFTQISLIRYHQNVHFQKEDLYRIKKKLVTCTRN